MENFRSLLKQEFIRRTSSNPAYSLRAFAVFLGVNHATLSSLISGKRKITKKTVIKLSDRLNLDPLTRTQLLTDQKDINEIDYFIVQQKTFLSMSEWYYDAILELSQIHKFNFNSCNIAKTLSITEFQAEEAVATLVDLGMLVKVTPESYKLKHLKSTNLLGENYTSSANRKYQISLMKKSIDTVETVRVTNRDHTSTTMAINSKDILKAKKIIARFRKELSQVLQERPEESDEVYQLQVSFFPLSENSNLKLINKEEI